MSESISVVNTQVDTFQTWIDKTNQVINAISLDALTANSTLGITSGNAFVNGYFGANNIFITEALRGGTNATSGVLNVTSNLLSNAVLSIGNATVNISSNSVLLQAANSSTSTNLTSLGLVSGQTTLNSIALSVGNASVNVVVNASTMTVGGNLTVLSTTLRIGNSSVNSLANSSKCLVQDSGAISALNSTAVSLGANSFLDTGKLSIGNNSVNALVNSSVVLLGANLQANSTTISVGNSTVNLVANSSKITLGANLLINSTMLAIGNASVNASLNSSSLAFNGTAFTLPMKVAAANPVTTYAETRINFVAGNNIFLEISDDAGDGQINVQINAVATSGSGIIGGTNTNIQFNDSTNFNGTNAFSFSKATNTVSLSNTLAIGANVVINTAFISIGNSGANLLANSIILSLANSTSTANLQPSQLVIGGSLVNSTAVSTSGSLSGNTLTYANGSILKSGFNITVAGTLANTVDFWPIASYRAAQYFYTIKDETSNCYHTGGLHVLSDGTNGLISEFGVIVSNTDLGKFSASQNASHILVQFTSLSVSTTIKGARTLIPV